jgi:hypothetical protein
MHMKFLSKCFSAVFFGIVGALVGVIFSIIIYVLVAVVMTSLPLRMVEGIGVFFMIFGLYYFIALALIPVCGFVLGCIYGYKKLKSIR